MRQVVTLRGGALALLLSLVWLLAGCYPELDWRELSSTEGRFKVLMPARPSMASGTDAAGRTQNLWTAEAGGTLYSVGYTDFGEAADTHLLTVRNAMVRSARGKLVTEADTRPPHATGRHFVIRGWAGDGSDRIVMVWLFPRGGRLYQLAISAKPDKAGTSEVDTFVLSFKPE